MKCLFAMCTIATVCGWCPAQFRPGLKLARLEAFNYAARLHVVKSAFDLSVHSSPKDWRRRVLGVWHASCGSEGSGIQSSTARVG